MKLTSKLILGFTLILVVFSSSVFFIVESKMSTIVNAVYNRNIGAVANLGYKMFELNYLDSSWSIMQDKLYIGSVAISDKNRVLDGITKETGCLATLFKMDVRVATTVKSPDGKSLIGTKADPAVAETVLQNGNVYEGLVKLDGKEYMTHYMPLRTKGSGKIVGMLFVGIENDRVNSEIMNLRMFIGLVILAMLVIGIIFAGIMGHRLIGGINQIMDFARVIAKGDLTGNDIESNTRDEMHTLASVFNEMKSSLLNIVKRINEIGFNVQVSSKEINDSVKNNYKISSEIATAMQELAKDSERLAVDIGSISGKIENTYNELDKIMETADESQKDTYESIRRLKEHILEIGKSSKNIYGLSERFAAAGEEIMVSTEEQVSNLEGMVNSASSMNSNAVEMVSMVSKFKIIK